MLQASVQALVEPLLSTKVMSNLATPVLENLFLVGTHDGSFHCDEALAISMLQLHPTFQNKVQVLRTRNPELLSVSASII
jgi:hypothetical protein